MISKIKPDTCAECRFFEWNNKNEYCNYYHDYLNNLNVCEHGDIDDSFENFLTNLSNDSQN